MATGIVRSALSTVIEKTPSQSSRSCKVRHWAQEILDKACQGESEIEQFDSFCAELVKHLQAMISSITSKYRLKTSKMEHLWREFQAERVKDTLPRLWKQMITKLGVNIDDALLEQSLYQEIFEMCLKEYFTIASQSSSVGSAHDVILTADELNILRYVSGYVARQLLRRYEKKSGEVYRQYVTCLGEMAVAGEGDDILSYTRKWMEKVNRGGLFPINDDTFHLFIEIEKCVRIHLPNYLHTKPKGSFQQSVHDKIVDNEDVQFHWVLLSQDIEDSDDSVTLLTEIVKLCVTIRGFAMVASWMEVYKNQENKNTQKSTGLRKSLSGVS